jgi:hypothetical protein
VNNLNLECLFDGNEMKALKNWQNANDSSWIEYEQCNVRFFSAIGLDSRETRNVSVFYNFD